MIKSAKYQTENADIECRFGFIKYNSYFDAENCIRAFFYLGYEAKFARVHSVSLVNLCLIADPTPAIPQCTAQGTSRSQEQQPIRLKPAPTLE